MSDSIFSDLISDNIQLGNTLRDELHRVSVLYWSTRKGTHPELPHRVAQLLKRHRGQCAECGLLFTGDDLIEVDHMLPKSAGGTAKFDNLQPLHRHCHDVKTARDISLRRNAENCIEVAGSHQ
jgi:5-methylcytosine-specific restriction endonuclease McrA